jgi:mRNA-degrading endonuclease RelE of RelBE toxin-antitoxin system
MIVNYSKGFEKEVRKQSGKAKESVLQMIKEVKQANTLDDITNCKKIKTFKNIYRISIDDFRAFFVFHVRIEDGHVYFLSLLSRGHAYSKKNMQLLKKSNIE